MKTRMIVLSMMLMGMATTMCANNKKTPEPKAPHHVEMPAPNPHCAHGMRPEHRAHKESWNCKTCQKLHKKMMDHMKKCKECQKHMRHNAHNRPMHPNRNGNMPR